MNQHSREPWTATNNDVLFSADGEPLIAGSSGESGFDSYVCKTADARRIVLCVNALAGLDTNELEEGWSYQEKKDFIFTAKKQRDDLISALELLLPVLIELSKKEFNHKEFTPGVFSIVQYARQVISKCKVRS